MKSNNAQDTTFYYLALLKEDASYPDQKLIKIDGEEYGIHGLWAQIDKQSYPQFCNTKSVFNDAALEPIRNTLKEFWHSNRGSDEHFWKHEWLKHGTCTNPGLSELDFFSKVIELYKLVSNDKTILQKYKKNDRFLIPFDLEFKLIK